MTCIKKVKIEKIFLYVVLKQKSFDNLKFFMAYSLENNTLNKVLLLTYKNCNISFKMLHFWIKLTTFQSKCCLLFLTNATFVKNVANFIKSCNTCKKVLLKIFICNTYYQNVAFS